MQVRYIVKDVDASIAFYTEHLGFACERQYGPAMAILERDGGKLWLEVPEGSHQVILEGALPPRDVVQIALPALRHRVVLTMRSDFEAYLVRFPEFRNPSLDGTLRPLPGRDGTDGFFVACLRPTVGATGTS